METPEIVQSNIVGADRSFLIRFVPNVTSNEKAPKFRGLAELPGAFSDLVTEFPIFQSKDGSGYSVAMPGGKSFPTIRPGNVYVQGQDGKVWESTTKDPKGLRKSEALLAAITHAFGVYKLTGEPEQLVTVEPKAA